MSIGAAGLRVIFRIVVALAEVEPVAGISWLYAQRLLEDLCIVAVFVRVAATRPEPARVDKIIPLPAGAHRRRIRVRILVKHSDVAPGKAGFEQLPPPVGHALAVAQVIAILVQLPESQISHNPIIRIDHPHVVGFSICESERLGAVVTKILPRAVV